jgi:hypothetical protein
MDRVTISINGAITIGAVSDGNVTMFAGVAKNSVFNIEQSVDRESELLIRAVNNRTRERNYFRKYCELLENQITDEDFDKEISENEDDYVVPQEEPADKEDWLIALRLAPRLKDTDYVDDIATLFSISQQPIPKLISTNNGEIHKF